MDKEVSLRGCLDSKAENEIWCLKSIVIMLDTTKDLGHPAFIKKNSPFLLEAALEVLEELRNNFGEDHGKRKLLI